MNGDIDIAERTFAMKRGQFSIKEMLAQQGEAEPEKPPEAGNGTAATAAAALPSLDDLSPLPGPGDPYKAYARPANQMLPTLVLLLADASAKGFSYGNLDQVDLLTASDPGQGPVIALRFTSVIATEVRIMGRNLDFLYNLLGFHRIGWVRERSPSGDFIPEGETVITGITITKVGE
jgi:hypothetical protein